MKFYVFVVMLLSSLFFSCANDHDSDRLLYEHINFKLNNSLPQNPDTLKILGIGNSFTDDAMIYIPQLLERMGIKNVVLGKLAYSGCSLQQHTEYYNNNSKVYTFETQSGANRNWNTTLNYTFKDAISSTDWDIIILQQVSDQAGVYDTYQPYLNVLLNKIHSESLNKNVVFGWHMTWAYATNSTHSGFKKFGNNQVEMYQNILQSVKFVQNNTGLKVVIPSGTAIQNLRNSSINNAPLDLTRDGYHIDLGVGRFTLACTWFQTLIAPCFGLDISKLPFIPFSHGIPVSLENYNICKKAVKDASVNKFVVTKK